MHSQYVLLIEFVVIIFFVVVVVVQEQERRNIKNKIFMKNGNKLRNCHVQMTNGS